jgi:hypothetical protein
MEFLPQQCAVNSAGTVNNLLGVLFQTLIAAQCGLKPDWPEDYGPTALENGESSGWFEASEFVIDCCQVWKSSTSSSLVLEPLEV